MGYEEYKQFNSKIQIIQLKWAKDSNTHYSKKGHTNGQTSEKMNCITSHQRIINYPYTVS